MKLFLALLAVTPAAWCAAIDGNIATTGETAPPFIQVGILAGRDGAAFGPGTMFQVNIMRFGIYGFAGQSSVNGYKAQGAIASFSDGTYGVGTVYRAAHWRRFTFGGFVQADYYGSKVRATYFDEQYQTTVMYRQSNRDPLVTIGPEIDYRLGKGVSFLMRPGKDFGKSLAATTFGGFSIYGGVLFDAQGIARGTAKGIRKLFR